MINNLFRIAAVGLFAGLLSSQANAVGITFTSNGTLACASICSVAGDTLTFGGGSNPSTLVANDFGTTNTATNQNDFVIGQLTWTNNATGNGYEGNISFSYTFAIAFTAPNASADSQLFSLTFDQPVNPTADNIFNISNATLQGLSFTLAGVTVSDLHFRLNPADTAGGFYNGSTWVNNEEHVSRLQIVADFTEVTTNPNEGPVPEASTWAMMLLGFAGVGFMSYRRRRNSTNLRVA
jgi:hypothetical protein